jgi:hypothetical protein
MTSIRINACGTAVSATSARAGADSYQPAPAWQTSELVILTNGKRHFMTEPARHLLEPST